MDETASEAAPSSALDGDGKPAEVRDEQENADAKGDTSIPAAQSQSISATLQSLTDKALHFLSHASNETLGACLAGLGVTTYVVLGRVGLVIIGVAGGVVLHATWEGVRNDNRDEATKAAALQRRRETGIDVARRLLETRQIYNAAEPQGKIALLASQDLDFSAFQPKTAASLNDFADAVIKDYVNYWYTPTIPNEIKFPAASRRTLVAFVLSLSAHLQRKRPADSFLDFITNASSIIIVFLNELSAALRASPNSSAENAINTYLEMKPDSNLAHVLDEEHQEHKLAMVAEDILQAYLDPKAYNCEPVHVFLKEVLSKLVLGYTMEMCSKPEWINDWLVYGLEESETTKEVMDIVDAGVEGRVAQAANDTVAEGVKSKKEGSTEDETAEAKHQRKMSRAEEAMDEAMKEAQRLTQLMVEEDERRTREERGQQTIMSSSEDFSDAAASTRGAPTPTSSQSDKERNSQESLTWNESGSQTLEPSKPPSQPVTPTSTQPFTNFDQLVPNTQPTAFLSSPDKVRSLAPVLTLFNANICIFDDSVPNERTALKTKPTTDYLIQIEPASSSFPGWMIARKYADFEILHEVLRRISVITGARFGNTHSDLPKWKTNTKAALRSELERYLSDAVRFQSLAESEGMKRFLDKDQGGGLGSRSPSEKKGFGWPTPDAFGKFGGDMMNVLTKAPQDFGKGVAGGGKAIFGGVAGLVGGGGGGGGGKKGNPSSTSLSRTNTDSATALENTLTQAHQSRPSMGQLGATDTYLGSMSAGRQSQDSLRAIPQSLLERRESTKSTTSSTADLRPRPSTTASRPSSDINRSAVPSPGSSQAQLPLSPSLPATQGVEETFNLPPRPDAIPDDYGSPIKTRQSIESSHLSATLRDAQVSTSTEPEESPPPPPPRPQEASRKPQVKAKPPLTEQEASVAIELMFAVVTEVYNLSSAWQIRRTLLIAAKNFLLRPGNPQLLTIQSLLQSSLLDSNLDDDGMAGHILNLRKNALPTEAELEAWKRDYPEKTSEQKEDVKRQARDLLVKKGMPQALTSVMGAAASGEALGKVFDCLQVERVSRGLVFGLILQALKVITH